MTTPERQVPNFYVGACVDCAVCGKAKCPLGRSGPLGGDCCDHECKGYLSTPFQNDPWPGEKREDFGYPAQFVADMLERDKTLEAAAYLRGLEAAAKICEAMSEGFAAEGAILGSAMCVDAIRAEITKETP